ncbi:hydrogenase maturation carbamoyl dehydratase HypE [Desulfosoma caldarium]|uniref:Hydrogenase maturation carbamoyl dehydratase HypE n=1 Tax=Desulfosoma caldarium TaxID=610254 RepID=A0A3N1UXD2_9BACT|nr:hydrogenase maturation carbamoyl dehydratase HypE [Desulfosoma caldarium]
MLLDHGSGGRATHELVTRFFAPLLSNPFLDAMNDSAVMDFLGDRLAFTTDSYVVDPVIFPGGNIGSLAVHGTVNDLAMSGARPMVLTAGFILEEGLDLSLLETIVRSMAEAAREAGVTVVAGDTKVVPKGKGDKIFITTAGVGIVPPGVSLGGQNARPGDAVLINGTIGDHGTAILCSREGLSMEGVIQSDSAPLHTLVAAILTACAHVHVLRDPTRGGVATTLNEIASQSRVGIRLFEEALPIREDVAGACEILGLDPLYMANEGKVLVVLPQEEAGKALDAMRRHPLGRHAALIGEVMADHPGRVTLRTRIGGHRIVDMLRGEPLPRIC